MKKLVILGAGTAGTMAAHHLRRALGREAWEITIIDEEPNHYYQPGFLLFPFGKYAEHDIVRQKKEFIPSGVEFRIARIERIDAATNTVLLEGGSQLPYDLLVIATGVRTAPEETPGLLGWEWRKSIFDFYTYEGARALREALPAFTGGRVVVHVIETPVKCPVAPLEFCFLVEDYFRQRGIRDNVELTYVTPLDGAFTKPIAAKRLGSMFETRDIALVADFGTESIDNTSKEVVGYNGRRVPFDLLVTIPANLGDPLIKRSGLGDELNLIPVDPKTLQASAYPNIFVVGDAGNFPTSKAGSVAHFQMETLRENVRRSAGGEPLIASYDGHTNCFVESGQGKALLLDFNYEEEPMTGRFPIPVLGPMPLLEESRINHWGKLAFRWMYWNLLMRGRGMPGIRSKMISHKRGASR